MHVILVLLCYSGHDGFLPEQHWGCSPVPSRYARECGQTGGPTAAGGQELPWSVRTTTDPSSQYVHILEVESCFEKTYLKSNGRWLAELWHINLCRKIQNYEILVYIYSQFCYTNILNIWACFFLLSKLTIVYLGIRYDNCQSRDD